jgi:hypothetical protein
MALDRPCYSPVNSSSTAGYIGPSSTGLSHGVDMRFVIVFMLAATADFLWAGYISAVSGKQAGRAAAWSMAIAIVSG